MDKDEFKDWYGSLSCTEIVVIYMVGAFMQLVNVARHEEAQGILQWVTPVISLLVCLLYFFTIKGKDKYRPDWLVYLTTGLLAASFALIGLI